MKKLLITGGCGFIGTNLIERLLRKEEKPFIRVLDNLSIGTEEVLEEVGVFTKCDVKNVKDVPLSARGVELVVGDVRDIAACMNSSQGIDTIVHLAASTGVVPSVENPRLDMEVNAIGTFNMLEAARQHGVKCFIFASSGAPLGDVKLPVHEESAPKPVSPYGASKLTGEGYCSAYYRTYGLKTVSLRFSNVYGPRSYAKQSVIVKFIKRALEGEALEIYGDGRQTRDFIHVDDLVKAIMLALDSDCGGELFQIATNRETSVSEIALHIKEIVEAKTGNAVNIVHSGSRTGDVRRNFSDISKARKFLGFKPHVDLDEGLENTINWFMSRDLCKKEEGQWIAKAK